MNFRFYTDIVLIIISWLFMFAAYRGWGNKIICILKLDFVEQDKEFAASWLGWSFSILFFSLINLFVPINLYSSFFFFLLGLFFFTNSIKKILSQATLKKSILPLIFAVLIAIISIQLPYCYDTGLYHLNSIRWLNEHPHIIGIGNLHHRLGFNQLFFTYIAHLNFHPLFNDYAFHVANGFLFVLLGTQLLLKKNALSVILFAAMFFIPMPLYWLASTSPDLSSTVLQLTAFYYFIKLLREKECFEKRETYIAFIAVIAAVSTVIKLSNAAFSIGLALTSYLLIKRSDSKVFFTKRLIKTFAFIGILLVIWLCRGYMGTGYPLFPTGIGRTSADWALPEKLAKIGEERIYCFARLRNYEFNSPLLKDYKWVKPWFENIIYDIEGNFEGIASVLFVCISIICFAIWLIKTNFKTHQKENALILVSLWAAQLLSIIFWFFTAPDIRFANGLFITFFLTGILLVKSVSSNLTMPQSFKSPVLVFILLFYVGLINFYVSSNLFYLRGIIKLPKVPMIENITDSGLKLLTPQFKDQCWDSDIPSTPEYDPKISLRGESIRDGFKMEQPLD
ncbi:MAG: hypothetical protein PHF29_09035 [Candidatus Riflebacteria bacterium]|nr:hypothetical protein [Candidatus Riflebacteria bacterium]